MHTIYHLVPGNMRGSMLYPLNMLKEKLPEIYAQAATKYEGREQLMQRNIPILDCLWNDVLHFSAVHPKEIKQKMIDIGFETFAPWRVYEIDASRLESQKTVVYVYSRNSERGVIEDDQVVPYNPHNLEQYNTVSDATIEYFRDMFIQHKRPLLYHRIPHVLFRGSLDMSGVPIVEC